MPNVPWLEAAVSKRIDPWLQVMRPASIDDGFLEPPVRGLVWALNHTGAVETLASCGGHPFEEAAGEPATLRRTQAAFVLVHVLDDEGWRKVAATVAGAIQQIPGLSMTVTFDHEAHLWVVASPALSPFMRRALLDRGLDAAAEALQDRSCWQEGLAAD